jgi:hypothetical protein
MLNRAMLAKVYGEALKPYEISPKDVKDKSLRVFYVTEGGVLKQGPLVPKKNFDELQGLRPDTRSSILDYAWNVFRNNPITFVIRGAFDAARTVMSVVFGGRIIEESIREYEPVVIPEDLATLAESQGTGMGFFVAKKASRSDDLSSAVFEIRHDYKTPPLLNVLPHSPFISLPEGERGNDVSAYFNHTPSEFMKQLKATDSIDLFLHGYNVRANKSLDLRDKFSFLLKKKEGYSNINALVSWSGDVGNNFFSKTLFFNRAVKSTSLSWEGIAKTTEFLRSYNPDIKINATTHSLGAGMLLEAASHGVKFGTVILLVPAVDNEALSPGGKYEKALQNIDKLIVVYSKSQPEAFVPYQMARFDRALGDVGPSGPVNHPNFMAIDATKADRNEKYRIQVDNHGDIFDEQMIRMMADQLRPN